jgi:2-dehydro-3-deoxyphosphogluconate aldolase/(4S)-4-hydroxy-2-oxoglutarate aldolase
MAAWKACSDFVKVIPCSVLGGAKYVGALKLPFPNVLFIAAGGVNQNDVAEFIRAGAVAVRIGRDLIPLDAVRQRKTDWIQKLAGRFLQIVKEARPKSIPA